MWRYILVLVLLLPSAAFAGEPRIVETENGITVEYTGTPEEIKKSPSRLERAQQLTTEIDRLDKEGSAIMRRSGTETAEELKQKRDRANEIYKQMQVRADELRKLRDESRSEVENLKKKFAEDNAQFEREHKPQ